MTAIALTWFAPPSAIKLEWFGPDARVAALAQDYPESIAAVIGPRGGKGDKGDDGTVATIDWTPPSALSTWLIPHNLGRKPSVTVTDGNGEVVLANVTHLDVNTVSIAFANPVTGHALLV